jgi:uncharacterized protein
MTTPQYMRTPLLTIFAIFISLLIYTKVFGPIPFSINSTTTTKANLFTVSGVGEAAGIPDTAKISIGITKTAQTVESAQSQTNSAANKIIEDLKNIGISDKDIKTTNYSVNPNYDFRNGSQNITGYTVSQNLQVNVSPIDRANQAIDISVNNGANLIGGINFTFNDKTKKDLERKARTDAVKKAKEKAQELSQATGIRLGKIVDVQESQGFNPVSVRTFALDSTDENTNLQPGENTISLTLTLSYETF